MEKRLTGERGGGGKEKTRTRNGEVEEAGKLLERRKKASGLPNWSALLQSRINVLE
jgi:hypothetical protein